MRARGAPPLSAANLAREIGGTRTAIALTLDALGRKFGARLLLQKAIGMTRQSKGRSEDARSMLGDTLRANPIPLALIGFGLAWFIARNSGAIGNVAADARLRAASRRIGGTIGIKAADGLAAGRIEAEGWVHQAASTARGALRTVRDSAAVERAEQLANEAGERASQLGDRLADAMERHPLLVGAVGLVSGAALASLLPPGKSAG